MSDMTPAEAFIRNDVSLKKLISEKFKAVEEAPYLTPDSWLRSSSFHSICPREEVLCSTHKVTRIRKITADLNLIFQHGHALHHQLQNEILPRVGVLKGKWICNQCGTMDGGEVREGFRVETWATLRPDLCLNCSAEDFRFHEHQFVDHEYRISGHCDGFLELEGIPGLGILEGKSIGPGWEVQNVPKLDHVVQLQVYMWLSDLQWGIILYWQKGENGLHALIEHFVERDEETIDKIKSNLKSIWEGVGGGEVPERELCYTYDCPRAKECQVRDQCFGVSV